MSQNTTGIALDTFGTELVPPRGVNFPESIDNRSLSNAHPASNRTIAITAKVPNTMFFIIVEEPLKSLQVRVKECKL